MTSDSNRADPILPPGPPVAPPRPSGEEPTQTSFPAVAAPGAPGPAWGAPVQPSATPPPSPAGPAWHAGPSPAHPAYPASPAYSAYPAPPARPPRSRNGVSPLVLAVAIVATALLTAGSTYLAVEAAHQGTTASEVAAAQPSSGAGAAASAAPSAAPGLASPNPLPANGQASIPDIVKAVSPAVVTITASGVTSANPFGGGSGTGTAVGSGIIFDANGLVLTNHHVVAGSPSTLTVTLKDGRTLNASIYGVDTLTDLAIVRIEGASGLPTAPIGSSAGIQVGQEAIAIGSPLGDLTGSVTSGIISALGRQIDAQGESLTNLIQTDTPINPGNSGGPLLDAGGNVIGVNTAISTDAQNIGFAIPIDIAKPLLAQAAAGQPLARAWLGVRFMTIDPALAQAAGLPVANGAWVPSPAGLDRLAQGQGRGGSGRGQGSSSGSSAAVGPAVVAGSPAARAGLAAGDIITAIDGTSLDATHTLDLLLGQRKPGDQVTLSILRDGKTSTVTVTLGTRPQSV